MKDQAEGLREWVAKNRLMVGNVPIVIDPTYAPDEWTFGPRETFESYQAKFAFARVRAELNKGVGDA